MHNDFGDIYGVATISRLLKIIGLFYKRALQKRPIFSKERYNFKEPTNRSHLITRKFQRHVTLSRNLVAHSISYVQ